jgi:hypothetical protein
MSDANKRRKLPISIIKIMFLSVWANAPTSTFSQTPCNMGNMNPSNVVVLLLQNHNNHIILDSDQYLAIHDLEQGSVWTFTKIGHPAHPAMICRYPIKLADGKWHTQIEVHCGGPKDACDTLVQQFRDLR